MKTKISENEYYSVYMELDYLQNVDLYHCEFTTASVDMGNNRFELFLTKQQLDTLRQAL